MNIALVGGSGFIGTNLAHLFNSDNIKFTILDKVISNAYPDKWKYCDVTEYKSLITALAGHDLIINLAAEHKDLFSAAVTAVELNSDQKALRRDIHKTIAKVSDDIGRRNVFNTAVAAIMELANKVQKAPVDTDADKQVKREGIQTLIQLLNPITPHLSQYLWKELGFATALEQSPWPVADAAAMVEDEKLVVVQINGKVRAKVTVAADATEQQVLELAHAEENVQRFLEGVTIRKVIYVPGKLLSLAVG